MPGIFPLNLVTDDHHFKDDNLHYQFTIDKLVSKKLATCLCPQEVTQTVITGSPLAQRRNPTLKNLPPISTGRSSPVPFRKQRTIDDSVMGTWRTQFCEALVLADCACACACACARACACALACVIQILACFQEQIKNLKENTNFYPGRDSRRL